MEKEPFQRDGLTSALEDLINTDLKDPMAHLRPEKKPSKYEAKSRDNDAYFDMKSETNLANQELGDFFDPVSRLKLDEEVLRPEDFITHKAANNTNTQRARREEISFESENSKANPIKSKTTLRMKYEAEKSATINRLGDLESIRNNLGLSQRKICQLLLVDPSAWSRWTNGSTEVPPHIYRSLEWYIALNDKYPQMGNAFWLSHTSNSNSSMQNRELKEEIGHELSFNMKFELEKQLHLIRQDLQEELKSRIDSNFEINKSDRSSQIYHWNQKLLLMILLLNISVIFYALLLK